MANENYTQNDVESFIETINLVSSMNLEASQVPSFDCYEVSAVDSNGRLSLRLPETQVTVAENVSNQTPYNFKIGDKAIVMRISGKNSTNFYVCAKVNPSSKDYITFALNNNAVAVNNILSSTDNSDTGTGGNGVIGQDGKDGKNGTDGNKWFVGSGIPGTSGVSIVVQIAEAELGYYGKQTDSQLDNKTANIGIVDSATGAAKYTKYARDLISGQVTPYNNKQGLDWCCTFVDWCLFQAAGQTYSGLQLTKPNAAISAGVGQTRTGYVNANKYSTTNPTIGQQIIFNQGGSGGEQYIHTGLIVDVDDTYIYTIEGNVAEYKEATQTWDYTHRMVQRRTTPIAGGTGTGGRNYAIDGYGQVDYSSIQGPQISGANAKDYYLDTITGKIYQYNGVFWIYTGYCLSSSGSGGGSGADTWRPIYVNGTEALGTQTTTGKVNFINGNGTTVEYNSATGLKTNIKLASDVPTTSSTTRPVYWDEQNHQFGLANPVTGVIFEESITGGILEMPAVDGHDVTLRASNITSIFVTIPSTISHGFYWALNFNAGSTPATLRFNNQSELPLRLFSTAGPETEFNPQANSQVNLLMYSDGMVIFCMLITMMPFSAGG